MTGRWARNVLGTEISRRAFLKAAGAMTVLAATGTLGCAGPQGGTGPTVTPSPSRAPVAPSGKLVVASDPDPVKLVDRALDAFGGLGDIVRKGDRVIVKANFSWDRRPEQGANNHPSVLARIMQRCKEAGAGDVTTIDYTINSGKRCLDVSGIGKAVADIGCKAHAIVDQDFVRQSFAGTVVKNPMVPKMLLDADVLIDVPVVKSHGNTPMSASMKNLMGLVLERGELHSDLEKGIVELARLFRPDLTIADAYRVLKRGGPQGGFPEDLIVEPHEIVVSDDIVAVDAYATSYLDLKPEGVDHVRLACEAGLGQMDLSKIDVIKI